MVNVIPRDPNDLIAPPEETLRAANGSGTHTYRYSSLSLYLDLNRAFRWVFTADFSCLNIGIEFPQRFEPLVDAGRRKTVDR